MYARRLHMYLVVVLERRVQVRLSCCRLLMCWQLLVPCVCGVIGLLPEPSAEWHAEAERALVRLNYQVLRLL